MMSKVAKSFDVLAISFSAHT